MEYVGDAIQNCCGRRHGKQAFPPMTHYHALPQCSEKTSFEPSGRVDCSTQYKSGVNYPGARATLEEKSDEYLGSHKVNVPWDVVGKPMLPLLEISSFGLWEPKAVRGKLQEALKSPEKPQVEWEDFDDPGTEAHQIPTSSQIRNALLALQLVELCDGTEAFPSNGMAPLQSAEMRKMPIAGQSKALSQHPLNLSQSSPSTSVLKDPELSNSPEAKSFPFPQEALNDLVPPQTQCLPQETLPLQPLTSCPTDLASVRSVSGSALPKVELQNDNVSTPIVHADVRDELEAPSVNDEQAKTPCAEDEDTPASPSEHDVEAMSVLSQSRPIIQTPCSALASSGASSQGTRSQKQLRFELPSDGQWGMRPGRRRIRRLSKANS
eukprot:TRINITY_DN55956_c0_g1_i1.p1 TRINITY_DN55956_c0_g1~~TRINITY_DN55956_c0_g1_i1.p1  ORF type:complete len:379 (+),score=46.08 TRINITY_DN55956_c0_g1_i1:101-1237(+)